ncbi:hypothetical protein F1188_16585 [Roseospira marina]|uniref:Tetratricopeptide repeat protein n=1 Tax=Roseospira marina TaxID=140057 RepID=A0A5M6I994_9PROT|nr:hypothetical protein [Roseospira marina]KAA5604309.1 hypothetical protein F1188_16585 [Roseospira marina]MBB4315667.1 hypothetical protein [Roseospira marina]MBB5088725.1 hypothetical protein [Roseospira marina]
MASTTQAEARARRAGGRSFGRRDVIIARTVALVGLVLLVIGGVRLSAELPRIPALQFVTTAADRIQADDPALRAAARETALTLFDAIPPAARTNDVLRRYAGLRLMIAKDVAAGGRLGDAGAEAGPDEAGREGPGREEAARAADLARQALLHDPVDPLAWIYLAHATSLEQGGAHGGTGTTEPSAAGRAFRYLDASYDLAPVEPELAAYRMRLALDLYERWSGRTLTKMGRDLRALLRMDGRDPAVQAFRDGLTRDPGLLRLSRILTQRDPALRARWRALMGPGREGG